MLHLSEIGMKDGLCDWDAIICLHWGSNDYTTLSITEPGRSGASRVLQPTDATDVSQQRFRRAQLMAPKQR